MVKTISIKAEGNTMVILENDTKIKVNDTKIKVNLEEKYKYFISTHGEDSKDILLDISNFQLLNKSINRGDSIKDKTPDAELTQLGLFENSTFSKEDLKTLAHNVIEKCKEEQTIDPQTFSRDKKGDDSVKARYAGMNFNVGFDSGLGLSNYLDERFTMVVDTFGKYIDPSSSRDSSRSFPNKMDSLQIDETMFNLLGYANCSIDSAINIGHDKYKYDIVLSGHQMKNKDKSRKEDVNINNIFVGNKAKSKITVTNEKRAAIIGKSLGDKLQVFIMFIKQIYDKDNRAIHCISTCDEIVLLFCILLELPCFYTDNGDDKKRKGGDYKKVNQILYFNKDHINHTKAIERFQKEKKIVIYGYNSFIKLIREMNEDTPVIMGGDYKYYTYSKLFYDGVIEDLNKILKEVEDITISANNTDIYDINKKTQQIKTMMVNSFIKKGVNGTFLINNAKKYTKYTPLKFENTAYAKINLANKLAEKYPNSQPNKFHSLTFHFIATTYGASLTKKKGGMLMMKEIPIIENFFYTEPIWVMLKTDEYPVEKFDANQQLFESLYKIYNEKYASSGFSFVDVYSEMLYIFNFDPYYEYTHLEKLMKDVIQEFIDAEMASREYLQEMMDVENQNSESMRKLSQTKKIRPIKNKTVKKLAFKKPFLHKDFVFNMYKRLRAFETNRQNRASRQNIIESRRSTVDII